MYINLYISWQYYQPGTGLYAEMAAEIFLSAPFSVSDFFQEECGIWTVPSRKPMTKGIQDRHAQTRGWQALSPIWRFTTISSMVKDISVCIFFWEIVAASENSESVSISQYKIAIYLGKPTNKKKKQTPCVKSVYAYLKPQWEVSFDRVYKYVSFRNRH